MLSPEQTNFLLAVLDSVNLPGKAIDIAYSTKQELMAMAVEAKQSALAKSS